MTTRARAQIFGEHYQVFDIVFENLSRRYTREQKENFYARISIAMFPGLSRRQQWEVIDRSHTTVARIDYFQVYVSITDSAALWFMNLRLLQIRVKLGLKDFYYLKQGFVNIRMSEVLQKLQVLGQIVGYDRLCDSNVPQFGRPSAVRDYPQMSCRRIRRRIRM